MKNASPQLDCNTLFDVHEMERGAELSDCRKYRWILWRKWNSELPQCAFIGLNPSTADETEDDPTIRRCIGFAKSWNLGGLIMLNAFAFRATQPKDMKAAFDPVGYENNMALDLASKSVIEGGGIVIAAWGAHCDEAREREVCQLIGKTVHCLGTTKNGRPKHPLYLRADTKPEVFWQPQV
jgi:hypothetical protein